MVTDRHYRDSCFFSTCTGINMGQAQSKKIERHFSILTCTSFDLFKFLFIECILIEALKWFCGLCMYNFKHDNFKNF